MLVRLEDLENRARAAVLDFGGVTSAEALRMLCCDAAVVPIVLNGKGQPVDVGRATRTIPDGLRRAVAARDRGCAHPGCGRPASWCEVHHVTPWADGGQTTIDNLAMLCRIHHRQIHSTEWICRIRDGLPEFIPPPWVGSTRNDDPDENPHRSAPAADRSFRRDEDRTTRPHDGPHVMTSTTMLSMTGLAASCGWLTAIRADHATPSLSQGKRMPTGGARVRDTS